jgi:hypothetical protein
MLLLAAFVSGVLIILTIFLGGNRSIVRMRGPVL